MRFLGMALILAGSLADGSATKGDVSAPVDVTAIAWLDDYRSAYQRAEEEGKHLLVWFRISDEDRDSSLHELWQDMDVLQRVERFVPVRVTTSTVINEKGKPMVLATHPAFAELRGQPGFAIVDLVDSKGPHFGHVVSAFPIEPSKSISHRELTVLLDLPSGSLTQRTMIFAVRTHPDSPQSTSGEFLPLLAAEAESHSTYQAAILLQGHHNWEHRFYRLNDHLPNRLIAQEVCAESWPGETLLVAARSCVKSWRHSSGHWSAVSQAQAVYGYDIKRGSNGIWYATGVFGNPRQ